MIVSLKVVEAVQKKAVETVQKAAAEAAAAAEAIEAQIEAVAVPEAKPERKKIVSIEPDSILNVRPIHILPRVYCRLNNEVVLI